jgi:NTP pyrophosphatase (non-canonical NTP hydrolase)
MGEGWRGSPGDRFTPEDDQTTYSATPMTLQSLIERVHAINLEKGWFDDDRSIGDDCALLHSEISEMLEEYRADHHTTHVYYRRPDGSILDEGIEPEPTDKPEGFGMELADLVIRAVDVAKRDGVDLERCLETKLRFNATRPYRHGGKAL